MSASIPPPFNPWDVVPPSEIDAFKISNPGTDFRTSVMGNISQADGSEVKFGEYEMAYTKDGWLYRPASTPGNTGWRTWDGNPSSLSPQWNGPVRDSAGDPIDPVENTVGDPNREFTDYDNLLGDPGAPDAFNSVNSASGASGAVGGAASAGLALVGTATAAGIIYSEGTTSREATQPVLQNPTNPNLPVDPTTGHTMPNTPSYPSDPDTGAPVIPVREPVIPYIPPSEPDYSPQRALGYFPFSNKNKKRNKKF